MCGCSSTAPRRRTPPARPVKIGFAPGELAGVRRRRPSACMRRRRGCIRRHDGSAALRRRAGSRRRRCPSRSTGRTGRSGSNGTSCGRSSPRRRSSARNLALGWRLGASLEIDILAAADDRFVVAHDATLGPSTTGRGRVARMPLAAMAGLFHRDRDGVADPDAPVLSLAELVAPLRSLPRAPGANLQLDLKLLEGRALPDAADRRRGGGRRRAGARDRRRLALSRRGAPPRRRHARRAARLRSDAGGVARPGPRARSGAPAPPHGAPQGRRRPRLSAVRRRGRVGGAGLPAGRAACSTSASRPTPGPSIPARD